MTLAIHVAFIGISFNVKGTDNFIQGHEALKYVLDQVPELERPESLKFPSMRKYLATVVQVSV